MKALLRLAAPVVYALCACGTAYAQPYPTKPVRVIVPFPPGGANDIAARIVFPKLSELMGQTFILENRSGAGGTIGSSAVAQSKPDGYTLLIQTVASHVANAHLYSKLPYDPLRDFVGVSPMGQVAAVLTVHPSMPTRSVKEFIDLAKKRPNDILNGHSGIGSFTHLNGVLFQSRAGIQMTQVPFKGGGPAVIALVGGQTQAQVAAISELISFIKANRVRGLGVTTSARVPQLPDVPAISDTIPGYESVTWVSVFAPAGTPKQVLDRLNVEIAKVLKDPGTIERLAAQTLDPAIRSADDLDKRVRADYDTIGTLYRKIGVKLD